MLKFITICLLSFSVFIFGCGDSKNASEKAESQTRLTPDTSLSPQADSLFQKMDQTREQLKQDAEETKKAVDELLKDF